MHFKAWWKMCTDCKCTLDFWSIMPVVIAYINTNKPPTQSSDFYFISINVSWNTFVCIRKPPDPLKLQQACTVNYVEDWMLQSWIRKLCVTLGILLRNSNFLLLLSLAKKREKFMEWNTLDYTFQTVQRKTKLASCLNASIFAAHQYCIKHLDNSL